MRGLHAVFRKEVASFFVSPVAYVVIAMFLFVAGLLFLADVTDMSRISERYMYQAAQNPAMAERVSINMEQFVMRPLIRQMALILLFVAPLISMRLFSEEKKSGTIELLLTYPVHDLAIMLGKFLAAAFVIAVMIAGTCTFPLILTALGETNLRELYCGYAGLLLYGVLLVSLGTFVSSLTENQIVSGVIPICLGISWWLLDWAGSVSGERLGFVFRQMSAIGHLDSFSKGVISLSDLSFFVLFVVFFLFLTLRSLEAHRWRG